MANSPCPSVPTAPTVRASRPTLPIGRLGLLLGLLLAGNAAHAQWQTQSFTLKPGWNAIYLHVDGSHQSLDELIPDANSPVAEVWHWRPKVSTAQFTESPNAPIGTDSRWAVWTAARADVDTLQRMVGNGAYLVRNKTAANFNFSVKGRPVPPAYEWTTTGLNFIGFPTPAGTPPSFSTFLSPAPGLDLAKYLQNAAKVYRYPGNESAGAAPAPQEVVALTAGTTQVRRGEAYWVRGSTNYYNHYYGPVEVALQNTAGIHFRDSLGTYSLRLKNRTAAARTVTFNLLPSESAPAGQPGIISVPQLLVRGTLNPSTLVYTHTVLNNTSFTLTAEGEVGSEVEVVLGLNRSLMTAASGSLYAGVLRVADSGGLQHVDLPVSGTVPDAAGLWVGQATVDRVGQYLKQYPKVSTTNTLAASLARANLPAEGTQMPGAAWVPRRTSENLYYKAVASSLDGRVAVAGSDAGPGRLFVTADYGVTWDTVVSPTGNFKALACSGDGVLMAAAPAYGTLHISTNGGASWVARDSARNWIGLAMSQDGNKLAAAAQGDYLYLSSDRGSTWTQTETNRNWSSIAMSQDGTKLIAAVNPGQLFTSTDSGKTWTPRETNRNWYAVASSGDGDRLIACVDNAQADGVFISTNSGVSWQATSLNARRWSGVATSTDGKRLGAVSYEGGAQRIQLSDDGGQTWTGQSPTPSCLALAMSGDGTRVIALGYYSSIFTLSRQFADYEVDSTTGLIRDQSGRYMSTGVDTRLAKVPSPLPLRLILHNDAAASKVSLLQRVFVGKGPGTNTIVANREQWLDAAEIAAARRISTPHLPFSMTNTFWSTSANFNPGSVVTVTVPLDYNDHASNPFLHTFHPDHDNLDPKFKQVRPQGQESYEFTRQIKLIFQTSVGDFRSLTASAQGRSGTYEETITLGGKAGATRQFQLSGTFSLQRISPIATLTTQ